MSRHRDYQPTIERARSQAEVAQRREAKLREKKDEFHREMLRAQAAARIAGEEADHLREQVTILESMVRDLRSERGALGRTIGDLRARLAQVNRTPTQRLRNWFRDMLRIGAEA